MTWKLKAHGMELDTFAEPGKEIRIAGEVAFTVGEAYRCTIARRKLEGVFLGLASRTARGREKPCFAMFEDGELAGYKVSEKWALLTALHHNPAPGGAGGEGVRACG